MDGRVDFDDGAYIGSGDVTLVCIASDEPKNADTYAALGLPGVAEVDALVAQGKAVPEKWIADILQSDDVALLVSLAKYRGLTSQQLDRLLAYKKELVDRTLIGYGSAVLNVAQLDTLIERHRSQPWFERFVRERWGALNPAQKNTICAVPRWQEICTLLGGTPSEAMQVWKAALLSGDEDRVRRIRSYLKPLHGEALDLLLEHGSDKDRARTSMEAGQELTAGQIERMLQDPVADVQIGVLRRKGLLITPEQYARGLKNADENVRFWYKRHTEVMPTAEQIAAGLQHPNVFDRRGWASDLRYTLSTEQIAQGLNDPAIWGRIATRPETRLTDAQLDACTVNADVGTRFVCVALPNYVLNQKRFGQMMRDRNGNVWRMHIKAHPPAPETIRRLADELLQTADSCTRDRMLKFEKGGDLALSPAQVQKIGQMGTRC